MKFLCTLNFIKILLGLEDKNSEFFKYGARLFDLKVHELIKVFFAFENPELARKLGLRFNPKECGDFFLKTMLETFDYREKNKIERNDFVSLLLGLKDSFTKEELAAEGTLMFAAGYETSSTLMGFTFYELALNPEIQNRLREEINSVEKVDYESLLGMKYLDMVVSEGLRKYPPLADNSRKCTKDYKVPGTDFVIEEGTTVEFGVFSFHRDPEYFPDPMKFDPERFNEENVKKILPFTYLPFGEGPRNCIGMRFGLLQAKLAIFKCLKNFKLSPCEKTTIPMKFKSSSFFMTPSTSDLWLKVEKV